MKIKTIVRTDPKNFDSDVNEAMAEGYILGERAVLPQSLGTFTHYAQLVLPDPAPEPDPVEIDAVQALHIVKAACLAHKGPCNDCPMTDWCGQLSNGGDPTDWELPEV